MISQKNNRKSLENEFFCRKDHAMARYANFLKVDPQDTFLHLDYLLSLIPNRLQVFTMKRFVHFLFISLYLSRCFVNQDCT